MEVKPLSAKAQNIIAWPIVVVTAPAWAVIIGCAWMVMTLTRWLDPPRWRRVFAWWPVECDPWPDRGFSGWVWLETVWRNPASPGWTKYRREPPADAPSGVTATDAELGPGRNT